MSSRFSKCPSRFSKCRRDLVNVDEIYVIVHVCKKKQKTNIATLHTNYYNYTNCLQPNYLTTYLLLATETHENCPQQLKKSGGVPSLHYTATKSQIIVGEVDTPSKFTQQIISNGSSIGYRI